MDKEETLHLATEPILESKFVHLGMEQESTHNSTLKFSTIVENLMSNKIIFKLNYNQTLKVDGRIIKYSHYLKQLSSQRMLFFLLKQ